MRRRMSRSLKLAAASVVVSGLLATGRLSFVALSAVVERPSVLVGLVALQVAILGIGVFRWQLLLSVTTGRRQAFLPLLTYNWIGQFFGTFAPSTVATDVTRFSYVVRSRAGSPSATLASLLVDRVAGTIGTLALATILAHRVVLDSMPRAGLVAIAILGGVAVIGAVTSRRFRDAARIASSARPAALVAVSCAMIAMALKVISVWLITRTLTPSIPVADVFSVAPVGFLVESIPLAPGGMGTAHLAFEYLLGLRGVASGAGIFNAYFVIRLLVSLFGGIVWVLRRDRANDRRRDVQSGPRVAILGGPCPPIDDQSPRLHW